MLVLDGSARTVALAFTPDGKQLIVGQSTGPLDAWALPSGNRVQLLDKDAGANPILAVHPSGLCAFIVNNQTLVRVSLTGQPVRRLVAVGTAMIISPTGDWIITRSARDPVRPKRLLGFRCDPDGNPCGDWAAHGEWEVELQPDEAIHDETPYEFVGGDRFVTKGRKSDTLLIRDTATGELRATVECPSRYTSVTAVSRDGRRFAMMGSDKLYLWDTATWGKPVRVSGVSNNWIVAMAFHPTRPILATIQQEQTMVKFLDADTGKPVAKFKWKLGELTSVAFSPDGTLAAAGSVSGKIVVWDVDE